MGGRNYLLHLPRLSASLAKGGKSIPLRNPLFCRHLRER
jgi:hypothetical protein